MVAIFAGIIVLVNAISVGANHQFDFTALSSFSLTSQTKDVLSKMKEPVKATLFGTPTDDANHTGAYALNMLAQYSNFTNQLQIAFIDADKNPKLPVNTDYRFIVVRVGSF